MPYYKKKETCGKEDVKYGDLKSDIIPEQINMVKLLGKNMKQSKD